MSVCWPPCDDGGGCSDKPEMVVCRSWPTLSNRSARSRSADLTEAA